MSEKYFIDESSNGNIKISSEVINRIAQEAAYCVDGVINPNGAKKDGMMDLFNVKKMARSANVTANELEGSVDLYINVEYGKNMVDIAKEVQVKVKESVETMTDMEIVNVNVHINGVSVKKEDAETLY